MMDNEQITDQIQGHLRRLEVMTGYRQTQGKQNQVTQVVYENMIVTQQSQEKSKISSNVGVKKSIRKKKIIERW
jgi:hypothetical protein